MTLERGDGCSTLDMMTVQPTPEKFTPLVVFPHYSIYRQHSGTLGSLPYTSTSMTPQTPVPVPGKPFSELLCVHSPETSKYTESSEGKVKKRYPKDSVYQTRYEKCEKEKECPKKSVKPKGFSVRYKTE